MRIGTFFLRAGIVLVVLVLVTALTAHWASRSEAVLRWAAAQLAERLPGTLTLTGLHGALDRPIRIDAIDYRIGTTHIRAQQIDLEWSPAALLSMRQLSIGKLSVARLEVTTRPGGERAQPPEHLRPPMPVRIDVLEVRALRIDNGTTPVELSDVNVSYAADMDRHTLELKRIASPWGTGLARLELGTQAPFALTGSMQWDAVIDPAWPLSASLNVGGDLLRVDAHGSIRLRGVELPTQAVIAPFEDVQLVQLTASVDALDVAAWFPAMPPTRIHAQLQAAGAATGAPIQGTIEATNAQAGPLDSKRLPLAHLTAAVALEDGGIRLHRLTADLAGAGSAQGVLALKGSGLDARLQVRGLDLRGMHRALHRTDLNGGIVIDRVGERAHVTVDLTQRGMHLTGRARHEGEEIVIEEALLQAGAGRTQLQGKLALSGAQSFAASARLARVNPADFGAFPQARVSGTASVEGRLQPQWQARAEYLLQDSQWRGYRLAGSGRLALSAQRAHDVDARINLGRNVLQVQGAFGERDDRLQFTLNAPALTALGNAWGGTLEARGSVGGSMARPAIDASLNGDDVRLPGGYRVSKLEARATMEAAADPRIQVAARGRGLSAAGIELESAVVEINGVRSAHAISLHAVDGMVDLSATLQGGLDPALETWNGQLSTLENRGAEAFKLQRATALTLSRTSIALGPARIDWAGGTIDLQDTVYANQQIRSGGSVTGLRVRKLLALAGIDPGWSNDLTLGAKWTLRADQQVDGRIEVFREAGDIVAEAGDQHLALGIERLAARVDIVRNRIVGDMAMTSRTAGSMSAKGESVLSQRAGRWGLAGDAPLTLEAQAQLSSVRGLAAVFSPNVVVDGRLTARVTARGTIADPRLRGSASGDGILIEQIAHGVFLKDGVLQAEFTPRGVRLQEFRIHAGEGDFRMSGEYRFERDTLMLQWAAQRVAAVQMPDLLVVTSGAGTLQASQRRVTFTGALRADKGRVELRELGTSSLGDDVIVVGRSEQPSMASQIVRSQVDLEVDLGNDFSVSGRGLEARITGKLRVHNAPGAPLRADGKINVVHGTYEAYGRTLEIDQGTLLFAGAPSNPALDIRALRKNQQVEAGVRVTGTALRPEVHLVSVPDVPDMEKLAWLTLGRRLQPGSQSDTETLQRYAAALAATVGTGTLQGRVAKAVGLDEVMILPGTDPTTEGGVIQLGKRINDRIYILLEQRLSTAQNLLRVNYQLARDWSLRLESGQTDAVDLFYTLSFD